MNTSTRRLQVTIVDCHFVAPDGERFTIRTITRPEHSGEVYTTYRGGWRHKEYVRRSAVRAYIIKHDLKPVADHETSARASRDCTLDWVTWANTPAL